MTSKDKHLNIHVYTLPSDSGSMGIDSSGSQSDFGRSL